MEKLKITLRKGLVGSTVRQRETVKTLGLHKIGQSVVRDASPANLGLVNAVRHLVEVEEVK